MNRRDALQQLGALALLASSVGLAWGQAQESFQALKSEVPVNTPPGKIEVLEFFHYGCPHCQEFEPLVVQWSRRLPDDVAFMRVPVLFGKKPLEALARLYYTLLARKRLDLHGTVFAAVQEKQLQLDKPDVVREWVKANGLDVPAFMDAYNSFGVTTQMLRADQLARSYRIDSVPTMAVAGRFLTSAAIAGNSHEGALKAVDSLIARVRRG
jgi:thiol:disulfide interchange protein DsbA